MSSLSSERTLSGEDKIDGGTGYDVLRADLKANFGGFTADKGSMKNVEKAELTNSTGIARSFDATGTTGLKDFVLNAKNGSIALTNVQDATGHITLNEQAEGALSVGHAAAAVAGTTDTLSLNLNKVGTAAVKNAAGVTTTAAKYVSVTSTGLEKVAIDSQSGDNHVNLVGATGSTSVTVKGAGTTNIEAVATGVTSFDASEAKGAVTANLAGGSTLTSVKGGAGNDTITVDLAKVAANATLAGGAGTNTLAVAAGNLGGTTLQPTMSGFQTIEFAGATTGDLTLSAKNISDLATLSLKTANSVGGTVNVIGLQAAALNINTTGAQTTNGTNTGVINSTSASAINYTTAASATATTAQTAETVGVTITAGEATAATINVGAYTSVGGSVSVAKAAEVTLNVASGKDKSTPAAEVTAFTGTINAGKATSVVVDAKGNLTGAVINAAEASLVKVTTGSDANTLTLNTAKATNVELTATKGLDLTAQATDLTGAEKVTVKANGGHVTLGTEALSKVNTLTVAGAATASQFTVGALGSTTQDYALNVTATGLKAGLSVGAVNSKADISVDVAGTTGNNSITSINAANGTAGAGGNVTLNAAGSAGSTTVGNITAGEGKTVTVNGNGILGKNASDRALDLGAIAASKGTISLNVKDTLNAVSVTSLNAKTVTIEADGLAKALTIGAAGTATDVTAEDLVVKAAGALVAITLNEIVALKSVNYIGSETAGNAVNITAGNTTTPALAKDTLAVTIKGGIQTDTVSITSNGESAQGDLINANIDLGVGADTVTLVAGAGGFRSESTVLKNVETLLVNSTAGAVKINASAVSDQTISLGGVNHATAANRALTLAGTSAADTIDLTKATSLTGNDAVVLTVEGAAGADTIKLGNFASTVIGGAGADTITGGTAKETYSYDVTTVSTASNTMTDATLAARNAANVAAFKAEGVDTITNFVTAAAVVADNTKVADTLSFSLADLNSLKGTHTTGTYAASTDFAANTGVIATADLVFAQAGTALAAGTNGRFVFNKVTGELFIDVNGDTAATDATAPVLSANTDDILIVKLTGVTDLAAADITIVA